MHKRVGQHVRSNAIGYLALFVALGGTGAYAADTVFSTDIVDGEVRARDLHDDAVVRSKIADGAVGPFEISDRAIRAKHLNNDAVRGPKVLDGSIDDDDIADTGSLGTAEIDESTLFNDNSLDAADIDDNSTLGAAEIAESSLSVVEGVSTSRIRFGREQLFSAEAGPNTLVFESGVAQVNVEKNSSHHCSFTLFNSPFSGQTLTFVRETVTGTTTTVTSGSVGQGGSDATPFFSGAARVRWQAWATGNPTSTPRVITIEAAAQPSSLTCDFSGVMTIGA